MRNIIFRGKRINRNGEWGYGDLRRYGGNTWVFPHDKDTAYDADMVDPKTVGEFTGFHDKSGRGIFEGDIIAYDYRHYYGTKRLTGQVIWRPGGFIITVYLDAVISIPLGFLYGDDIKENTIEIVGNIHDMPDYKDVMKDWKEV
jgi:uncharacterized phage protein (TIGR01671 family)